MLRHNNIEDAIATSYDILFSLINFYITIKNVERQFILN